MSSIAPKSGHAPPSPALEPERFSVDSQRYPDVARVLEESGSALSGQLRQLLNELRPPRAPREPVKVIGKLLRDYRGEHVAESLVVLDISASGCVVRFAPHLELDMETACCPRLWFGVRTEDGPAKLEVKATLARFLTLDDSGITLAYRFEDVPEQASQLLYQLAHLTHHTE